MTTNRLMLSVLCVITVSAAGYVMGALTGGGFLSQLFYPQQSPPGDEHPEDDHGDEEHVHLTKEAYQNLGLSLGMVQLSDYYQTLRIPGSVIEKPGHSDHSIVAPVTGIVSRVYVAPGQAVRVGDPLFDLRVNDEPLVEAQVSLLETLTRLEVVEAEIKRLAPLAESGTVVGRKKLQFEYDRKELQSRRSARIQELATRGLNDAQIERIVTERELVRELVVLVPNQLASHGRGLSPEESADPEINRTVSQQGFVDDGWDYTIERFLVTPGQSVQRGDGLCHLAYHAMLYIEGAAFERDLERVAALTRDDLDRKDWTVTAEFGASGEKFKRDRLSVLYVNNHVDTETQTYRFYVPLRNEVVGDSVDDDGHVYRSWRFKPGQRVYLLIPVERIADQIKLKLDAIAQQGPEAFVFRVHQEDHDANGEEHADGHAHDEHAGHAHAEIFIEFEPVPVHILQQDSNYAVLSKDGDLKPGDVIATRNAYQLQLTLQRQMDSEGGHGHGHDHAH